MEAAGKQAVTKLDKTDGLGRVKLSAGKAARILSEDPVTTEKRLARARKLDPNAFIGAEGAAQFHALDQSYAEVGVDWLKTAERPHQEAAAEAKVARVAKQLDQAISAADGQRQQLLDAQAKAGEVGNAAAREAALGELRSQMDATIREPLRMLEQPEAAGRRLLDGKPAKAKKKGKNDLPPDAAKMDKRVRKRLKRLGRPATDYAVMLEAEVRGDPMPPRPRKAFKAPPAGVFADSLAVHAAVLKRMRELEAPEADYPKLLEQVLREGAER